MRALRTSYQALVTVNKELGCVMLNAVEIKPYQASRIDYQQQ